MDETAPALRRGRRIQRAQHAAETVAGVGDGEAQGARRALGRALVGRALCVWTTRANKSSKKQSGAKTTSRRPVSGSQQLTRCLAGAFLLPEGDRWDTAMEGFCVL